MADYQGKKSRHYWAGYDRPVMRGLFHGARRNPARDGHPRRASEAGINYPNRSNAMSADSMMSWRLLAADLIVASPGVALAHPSLGAAAATLA